jgi:N-acetylglucosaminyl-diphospho-decaprenol L-rhamnosyltransferase
MNNKLSDLTVNILTYKTNMEILDNCIDSISSEVKINIIENSKKFENEEHIRSKKNNINIICTGSNLGYAGGHNYGISKVTTRYVLILNPDLICKNAYFDNVKNYLNDQVDFHIIGSQYEKDKMNKPAYGLFEKKKFNPPLPIDKLNLQIVDWVVGCSMLIDLKKFSNKKLFDENFFLFYEETDFCRSVKLNNGLIFSSKDLIIDHYGEKGSFATEISNRYSYLKLRNWHLMWSSFYYYKKNYGYLHAFKLLIGSLIKSFFKLIFFAILFNKYNFTKHFFRFSGLLNSMIGKKSWFRIN